MFSLDSALLHHGGRVRSAAKKYGIPEADWLDLSTGINPDGWPVPALPETAWSCLPEPDDGLEAKACQAYDALAVLAVAGSQAAIMALPRLRVPCRVAVLSPCYSEHAAAWHRAGHQVSLLAPAAFEAAAASQDVLVLANPNNPTGELFSRARLLMLRQTLAEHGGWLVVDEAFMDEMPSHSLCPDSHLPGLIVLRSLGKFYGLAGARAGFVCAEPFLLSQLAAEVGPWPVSGPTRRVAAAALADTGWYQAACLRLADRRSRLAAVLMRHGWQPAGQTSLFIWICTPQAAWWQEELARQGILVRAFEQPSGLRFGLPPGGQALQRLDTALSRLMSARKEILT